MHHKDKSYVTTRSDMLTEIELLAHWKKSRGVCEACASYRVNGLDSAQQKAFDNILTSRDRVRAFRALPGKKRNAVVAATRDALPHAVMLDRPTLSQALEATKQHPKAVIVLLDTPRRDTPRQMPVICWRIWLVLRRPPYLKGRRHKSFSQAYLIASDVSPSE